MAEPTCAYEGCETEWEAAMRLGDTDIRYPICAKHGEELIAAQSAGQKIEFFDEEPGASIEFTGAPGQMIIHRPRKRIRIAK